MSVAPSCGRALGPHGKGLDVQLLPPTLLNLFMGDRYSRLSRRCYVVTCFGLAYAGAPAGGFSRQVFVGGLGLRQLSSCRQMEGTL